ncbi:EcoRV family type II restriction endonuclease [Flavobacterium psychrophilum]|uniref:EcoRV family type II restriction endonuclease n=1 Tax=Flavobacterium psychrophilum TaxID=96345 RepID=UPI0004F60747|nr:EcoRV family type II restriction endonuclease [Flavobacterium psychrophilum]AIN74062.1 restriction endonuclease [Flavobacterium psychrophilum FPG3]EKT2070526.1 EcoRV family type II restriction endonuclease [Flavobacterium psychrophilum]EKT2072905.1 EcoRV family type II restriction endonuclease [Flavobacterium psychrophilum]EKT4492325.1 EcoRV family type II restriction endonuclease [Flavobacterium psychrophilum]MBF2045258.1 restriction endonuclease [Flavobacterium psychrophilum]
MSDIKKEFLEKLTEFSKELTNYVSDKVGDWKVKGFIDIEKSVYTISSDTKIISKILEIQLFPKFLEFADKNGYEIQLAEMQNWYPDLSFVNKVDPKIKFAVDIKTTYRLDDYTGFCNGFTLGSHGEYFRKRTSTKNIQFPYAEYTSHICLGILYTRALSTDIDETKILKLDELDKITSVIKDLVFFAEEKWKISSDKGGSGNTANIGSIQYIDDIIKGNGVFKNLGEKIFDEYWINQGVLKVPDTSKVGNYKKLTKLTEFLEFKGMNSDKINPVKPKRKNKK